MKSYIKTNNSLCDIPIKLDTTQTVSVEDGQISIVNNAIYMYDDSQSQWECISSNGSNINSSSEEEGCVGEILAYYGETNPDSDHFVVCDGSTFDQTKFPDLYTLLGTNTTIDLRGATLVHRGANADRKTLTDTTKICLNCSYGPWKKGNVIPNHSHRSEVLPHCHEFTNDTHCHVIYFCCCICTCLQQISVPAMQFDYIPLNLVYRFTGCNLGCVSTVFVDITEICHNTCRPNYTSTTLQSVTSGGTVRYGSPNECKGKTKNVLFLMRGKID